MVDTDRIFGNFRSAVDLAAIEMERLRAAWAEAWLREYRCQLRYIALLQVEAAEELELRFAWLEWWDAACVCRDALRRLEGSQF
jgi:hypothetical protein